MKLFYKWNRQLIAYLLLISLFLQNCKPKPLDGTSELINQDHTNQSIVGLKGECLVDVTTTVAFGRNYGQERDGEKGEKEKKIQDSVEKEGLQGNSKLGNGAKEKQQVIEGALTRDIASWNKLNFNMSLPCIYDTDNIQCKMYYQDKLGSGGMGIVYQGTYQGNPVAIKVVKGSLCKEKATAKQTREAIIMANTPHKNIVAFKGFWVEKNALVMEYVGGGSLADLLLEPGCKITERNCYKIALDVAKGMSYLHNKGIIHRDLKSANILLDLSDGNLQAKVADFGISALKNEYSTYGTWEGVGTLCWIAPELFYTKKNSKAADVYSYGMILWQLWSRKPPFEKISGYEIIDHIKAGNLESISEDTPLQISKVIELCWLPENPPLIRQRPGINKVCYLIQKEHYAFVERDTIQQDLIPEAANKDNKEGSVVVFSSSETDNLPDINVQKHQLHTFPLHIVARDGNLEELRQLIADGNDINAADEYGWTPLHHTVASSLDEDTMIGIIKLLLDNHANINYLDKDNWIPLDHARQYSLNNVVALLIERGSASLITVGQIEETSKMEQAIRQDFKNEVRQRQHTINMVGQGNQVALLNDKNSVGDIDSNLSLVESIINKEQSASLEADQNNTRQQGIIKKHNNKVAELGNKTIQQENGLIPQQPSWPIKIFLYLLAFIAIFCPAVYFLLPTSNIICTQLLSQQISSYNYDTNNTCYNYCGVNMEYKGIMSWHQQLEDKGYTGGKDNLDNINHYRQRVSSNCKFAIQGYREAAEKADADAQNNLGFMYQNGYGVIKDYQEALEWYRKAAEQGHAVAAYNLGLMYENGLGVEKNYQEAVKYYKLAAEKNHVDALINLGNIYYNGDGEVAQDDNKAYECYQKALRLEKGHVIAQYNLGNLYYYGRGVEQSYDNALQYYNQSAKKGNTAAQNNIGFMYQHGCWLKQDYFKAFDFYLKSAVAGNSFAQNNLGHMYKDGLGISIDYQEALKWYQKAASQGHKEAEKQVKFLTNVDKKFLLKVESEAKAGDLVVQSYLGDIYYNGWGVKKDYNKAFKWFLEAAEAGNAEAQYKLGSMYLNGWVVAQNYNSAAKWFQAAAVQGHAYAQISLKDLLIQSENNIRKMFNGIKIITQLQDVNNTLDLSLCYVNDEAIASLLNEPFFKTQLNKTHNLVLKYNGITALGAQALANHLPAIIHTLNLNYNHIGTSKVEELVKALPNNINTLCLGGNTLGNEGVQEVAKSLRNTKIRTLDLHSNQIEDFGALALADALSNTSHTVDLCNNKIGFLGAQALIKALSTTIRMLDLSSNRIDDGRNFKSSNYLDEIQMHSLILRSNIIGSEGVIKLVKAFPKIQLNTFILSDNEIDDTRAAKLSKNLLNWQLRVLDLSDNQIGDIGVQALAHSLPKTLYELNLKNNKIGPSGAKHLSEGLLTTQVHSLYLRWNKIGDVGTQELAKILPQTQIHTLDLGDNQIGDVGAEDLAKILPQTQIHSLDLCDNLISLEKQEFLKQQYPNLTWYF